MQNIKILVVDDEKDILEVLVEFLQDQLVCDVFTADDGLDAFLKGQKEKFDLILTDHRMPLMSGSSFIHALRNKSGPNQSTPVLFFSQYIEEAKLNALTLDRVFFMEKDSYKQKLYNYLTMILGKNIQFKNQTNKSDKAS